ncbi:MAG: MATE family efflux transporter [Nannocystaceae bacterium]
MQLTDLGDEPPRLWTLRLEWPLVRRVLSLGSWVMLAMITQFFVNAADNLMVGRLDDPSLATASQAALGLGMPLFWAVGGFFSAVAFGTQAMTARRFAEGQPEKAGQVLFNSLLVAVIAGIFGACLGYAFTPHAIDFLAKASPEQAQLGASYTRMRMIGVPGMVLTFSYKAFFDGVGKTHVHLYAALAMNLLNIGLNYLLIYGSPAFGIPMMGLDGAGLASSMSTYVGLAIMALVSLWPQYRARYKFYRWRHRDAGIARTIVRLMIPSGSATVMIMTGFLLFMRFVGDIDAAAGGNVYSAATKAIMDTGALCFMPLIAFGTATATAVSQNLGAQKPNLAARYGWESVRVAIYAMTVPMTLFILFPHAIISLWAPNDPAVAEAGAASLQILATALPLMVVGLVLSQALYGAGANVFVMTVEGALHFGVLVPLSWLLGPQLGYGIEGVWAAAAVYINLLGLIMGARFLGQSWRRIKL